MEKSFYFKARGGKYVGSEDSIVNSVAASQLWLGHCGVSVHVLHVSLWVSSGFSSYSSRMKQLLKSNDCINKSKLLGEHWKVVFFALGELPLESIFATGDVPPEMQRAQRDSPLMRKQNSGGMSHIAGCALLP